MRQVLRRAWDGLALVSAGGWVLAMAGCASPGRPLPPSLKLPTPVKDLRAERVGGTVELHWTTPAETTDGVALRGVVTTELCRDPGLGARDRCTAVRRWGAAQGATTEVDVLPAELTAEATGIISYRVRLLNAAGRSAGLSNLAEAASGQAPAGVEGLRASSAAGGVRLSWDAAAGPSAAVELVRTEAGVAGRDRHAAAPAGRVARPLGKKAARSGATGDASSEARGPGVERLIVDAAATGGNGALDRTAERDHSYSYQAVRVRTVEVGGVALRLRSPPTPAVMLAVRDLLPPAAPRGLVAAADGMAVDLSWEPGAETDLAGYRVYRAEAAAESAGASWQPLTAKVLAVPGFRDAAVPHPGSYFYRVTAVDGSGNESAAAKPIQVEVPAGAQP